MAYASSYDKFEDLEYSHMMKSKQTKMYAKKRRPKCCGIGLGASYDVHSAMTSTLSTPSAPPNVTPMLKKSPSSEDVHSRQKRTHCVICVLVCCLAVVAFAGICVWVAGITSSKELQQDEDRNGNGNDLHDTPFVLATDDENIPEASYFSDPSSTSTLETTPMTTLLPNETKIESSAAEEITNNKDVNKTTDENVAFVIPLKQGPKPLHTHDILYIESRYKNSFPADDNNNAKDNEQKHNEDASKVELMQVGVGGDGEQQETANARTVQSGHFRDNTAEVFDPHPEYVIEAFGRRMVLELSHNLNFSPSQLRIVQIERNYSKSVVKQNPACYYTGIVRGEAHSHVGVSLCNGMTGYIKTSTGDYQIQPDETYNSGKHGISSIRHKMTKLPPPEDHHQGHHDHDEVISNPISFKPLDKRSIPARTRRKRSVYSNRLEDDEINQRYSYDHYGEDTKEEDDEDSMYRRNLPNSLNSKPYFIATLVVADRKMVDYHKNNDDLTRYILTLMAHVDLLFKDATIGNPITLVVVDIMILSDGDFTGDTSTEVLKKFCEFQHRNSLKKHDVALLLTRDLICTNATMDDGRCTTLGVAEVGSMCHASSSCAIIRDKGLSTSFTIAHELGHVLSMPHDDDVRCNGENGTIPNNIMGKSLHGETQPWHWSGCSERFLTEFLNSPRARCLLDEPRQDHIRSNRLRPLSTLLPGEAFQADRQCELEFGPGSKICSFMPKCSSLWCTHEFDPKPEDSGCKTQYMPWADGTPCDRDMWCLQGKCTSKNHFRPVEGGWGKFKPSGHCSRKCGGGIQMYVRECNSPTPTHGGPYCTGGSHYYESCNTEPCEQPEVDFREKQCARFNGNSKGLPGLDNNVRWVPKYGTNMEDACKLYCRVHMSTSYYHLESKVIDGTKCGLNSFDICVNGVCMKGGCDNRLNSNVTLDDCGVCGGNNLGCCKMTGIYDSTEYGYQHVLRIPKGSYNINIRQRAFYGLESDENYLSLREAYDGKNYLLNGNSVISGYSKDVVYGGLTFRYSGSNQRDEYIVTTPKTMLYKDVIVEVLQVGNVTAPNIEWNYTIPCDRALNYSWEKYKDKWTDCSSICNGTRRPLAKCMDMARHVEVDKAFCENQPVGNPVECNTHCYLEWQLVSKGSCLAYCEPGWRSLNYDCVNINLYTKNQAVMDKKHCRSLPVLPAQERCEGPCDSIRWEYHEWSHCSKSCGGGFRERRADCINGNNQILDDGYCSRVEKNIKQSCNDEPCPTWVYRDWSSCSATCGSGIRRRQASCYIGDQPTASHHCDLHVRKPLEEPCMASSCLSPIWMTGDWNECSGSCGSTYQQRLVTCMDAHTQEKLSDEMCSLLSSRPEDTRRCSLSSCEYKWMTSEWSDCPNKCGQGQRTRQVLCKRQDNLHEADDRLCDAMVKPLEVQDCEVKKCPMIKRIQTKHRHEAKSKPGHGNRKYRWHVDQFTPCSTNCGTGYRMRSVTCEGYFNGSWARVVDGICVDLPNKPPRVKTCKRYNCPYAWIETNWSSCSTTCGRGFRKREVYCNQILREPHKQFRRVSPSRCSHLDLPRTNESCQEVDCNALYHWKMSPWRQCRQPCGPERQSRRVHCVNRRNQRVDDTNCSSLSMAKPRKRRKCDNRPCELRTEAKSCRELQILTNETKNDDYLLKINGNFALVHCYKMDTNSPEEYITLSPGAVNFAEVYDKKLLSGARSCPAESNRRHFAWKKSENRAGKSTFWKVKLDVNTMRIIPDDFTFSTNSTASRIPFGTAGDCFSSMMGCVRGRFQIDLSKTSFSIAPNVVWIAHGQSPTARIDRTNKHKISGLCGGNCGGCMTNPRIGLQVEVT